MFPFWVDCSVPVLVQMTASVVVVVTWLITLLLGRHYGV